MYRKFLLFCLLFMPHTPGFSTLYQDHDPFTGERYQETGDWGGFKGVNELDDDSFLSLVPLQVSYPDETKKYRLKMQWDGPFLDFVGWRPKLILIIDGERISFEPDASVSHLIVTPRVETGDIVERAEFSTSGEVIKKIAHAKSVKVAVYTASGRLERSFSKKNRKIFLEFVTKVMDKK